MVPTVLDEDDKMYIDDEAVLKLIAKFDEEHKFRQVMTTTSGVTEPQMMTTSSTVISE